MHLSSVGNNTPSNKSFMPSYLFNFYIVHNKSLITYKIFFVVAIYFAHNMFM